jgi:hypothetical protein
MRVSGLPHCGIPYMILAALYNTRHDSLKNTPGNWLSSGIFSYASCDISSAKDVPWKVTA